MKPRPVRVQIPEAFRISVNNSRGSTRYLRGFAPLETMKLYHRRGEVKKLYLSLQPARRASSGRSENLAVAGGS